jgi:PhnB protein
MSGVADEPMILRMYPRLVVSNAAAAIDFYVAAFGAKELARHTNPEGKIVHAEVDIGSATFAVKDEDEGDPAPTTLGGTPVIIALDVADADAVGEAMVAAGATVIYPIQDWDYGRGGRLADPYGHLWMISQDVADLTGEEVQ